MQVGMIGLGRMGGNMVRRLLRGGHSCVVHDRDPAAVSKVAADGATGVASLSELAHALDRPRTAWLMVPAGEPTEQAVLELEQHLHDGDCVVDGGNTYFKDDVRRAKRLAAKGIDYVDAGTSGGVWGLERGYCLMVGGPERAVRRLEPILRTLAPGRGDIPRTPGRGRTGDTSEDGYLHCGPAGAGHFVKMIHNGIEYGLMQAYAEGFDVLRGAAGETVAEEHRYSFDLGAIAELWRRGSVVSSWLLDLTSVALAQDATLSRFTGYVQDSGEGRWTVLAAVEERVPAEVLTASLYARFRSRQDHTFAEKVLSAMREQFGGHAEKPTGP